MKITQSFLIEDFIIQKEVLKYKQFIKFIFSRDPIKLSSNLVEPIREDEQI